MSVLQHAYGTFLLMLCGLDLLARLPILIKLIPDSLEELDAPTCKSPRELVDLLKEVVRTRKGEPQAFTCLRWD